MATATPRGAAFFDLDRTLLAGASGEVFSHAMRAAGLVSRTLPGESLLYKLFNTVGETLPSMALARQAETAGLATHAVGFGPDLRRSDVGLLDLTGQGVECGGGSVGGRHRWGSPVRVAVTSFHDPIHALCQDRRSFRRAMR